MAEPEFRNVACPQCEGTGVELIERFTRSHGGGEPVEYERICYRCCGGGTVLEEVEPCDCE